MDSGRKSKGGHAGNTLQSTHAFDAELDAMFGAPTPTPTATANTPRPRKRKADSPPPQAIAPHTDTESATASHSPLHSPPYSPPPKHETLTGHALKPAMEPRHIQDKRSIFIGNIPIDAVKSRPTTKALKRHLHSLSPYPALTSIATIRYRSIPFSKPTDDFTGGGGGGDKRRERSALHRQTHGITPSDNPAKVYLNAAQKRKVAFIKRDVNTSADSVNAYATLSEPDAGMRARAKAAAPSSAHAALDALTAPLLASLLAAAADGTRFAARHLRVDTVAPLEPAQHVLLQHLAGSSAAVAVAAGQEHRRTVFVGNLDFAASEEELRDFFEQLLVVERGPCEPPQGASLDDGDGDSESDPSDTAASDDAPPPRGEWVRSVRIVRDSATQLGKGFAYVKFVDEACVDELMALHDAEAAFLASAGGGGGAGAFRRRLKFKKRALRVGRCKPARAATAAPAAGAEGTPARRARSSGAPTPGGTSPALRRRTAPAAPSPAPPPPPAQRRTAAQTAASAAALATLPKDARRAAKAADPLRAARRAEKKDRKRKALKVLRDAEGKGAKRRVGAKGKGPKGKGEKGAKKTAKAAGKSELGASRKVANKAT